jgi:sulfatase modifying factor 1
MNAEVRSDTEAGLVPAERLEPTGRRVLARRAAIVAAVAALALGAGVLLRASGSAACPEDAVGVQGPSGGALCVDRTEVTARAYAICVVAGGCTPAATQENAPGRAELVGRAAVCNYDRPDRQDHPINCLRWDQAQSFCTWARKRLPTREEWVFVAGGGDARLAHPWGNTPPTDAHVCWRHTETCPVGAHLAGATAAGIHDLVGNVWEMTSSRSGLHIVTCGGGIYEEAAENVLATRCGDGDATMQFHDLGFRCVR